MMLHISENKESYDTSSESEENYYWTNIAKNCMTVNVTLCSFKAKSAFFHGLPKKLKSKTIQDEINTVVSLQNPGEDKHVTFKDLGTFF